MKGGGSRCNRNKACSAREKPRSAGGASGDAVCTWRHKSAIKIRQSSSAPVPDAIIAVNPQPKPSCLISGTGLVHTASAVAEGADGGHSWSCEPEAGSPTQELPFPNLAWKLIEVPI